MEFTKSEIAIIYDALHHLENTTDVYSNPYDESSKARYTESFKSVFNKIENNYADIAKKGVFYFE
ncbi:MULTISPECIES: hypothetical protein [Staphylococcus]|uniref:hypothetical protein n=1 Tax=Staphylococcus TaxID=1279 RepID=UPI00066CA0CE|nr:hypothetical protein [Staphylococcus hominis]MCI2841881.1 hypothetical protein [Staphylococcus hominis]MCI2851618.1 hypothetical protein [Staphylococcus hominis]MCI2858854.1 hypothetical protein [Staphylococcus hominis]MCI2879068.1 hypothetical protein [Staphylococcus hominis]MDS3883780.1 hypothetical protein [Staphylococcus hominis]